MDNDTSNGLGRAKHEPTPLRIAADRMWRDPDARFRFEQYTGYGPEQAQTARYHIAFVSWAARELEAHGT